MSERYGDYEAINGAVANDLMDQLESSRRANEVLRKQNQRLIDHSIMLGQIGLIVKRYCRRSNTTTLEAVEAMNKRVKRLNKIKKK